MFLGRLDPGANGTEEGEFKKNDLMFHESGSQVRPQLFKMGDLSDENQSGIATKVRSAIADKKCRVVSVVINAIDDHLDSGKQVDFTWTRNTIRGLRDLLRQASAAERLVIMTSDHGHVLDFGTKQLPSAKDGRGDRYRSADGKTEEGELEFEGNRVYKATGNNRITLACAAAIRYGKDKRGYHGGANPQEMVIPLAILSDMRAHVQEGWKEIPSYQPAWWRIDSSDAVPAPVTKRKPEKEVEGLDLFESDARWLVDQVRDRTPEAIRAAFLPSDSFLDNLKFRECLPDEVAVEILRQRFLSPVELAEVLKREVHFVNVG